MQATGWIRAIKYPWVSKSEKSLNECRKNVQNMTMKILLLNTQNVHKVKSYFLMAKR